MSGLGSAGKQELGEIRDNTGYASISNKLDDIIENTSNIEIKAETVNLNTDSLEAVIVAMAADMLEVKKNTAAYMTLLDYDGDNNLLYVGEASPGSTSANAVWRIKNFLYDGSSNLTNIVWASGTNAFDKIWDNRTSYSYS